MKKKYVSVGNIWFVIICITILNVMIGLVNQEPLEDFIGATIYLIGCAMCITFGFSEDK